MVESDKLLLKEAGELIEDLVQAARCGTHWWEGLVTHEVPSLLLRIDATIKRNC